MNAAWPKVTFDDAPLQIIDGDRGSNYPKQDEFHDEGHCLFLNTGNVTKSGFEFGNCQFITEQKDNLLRKGKLSREDVIMTTRGTIGNVGYFNRNVPFEHIRINSGMVIFRADRDKLLPSFLYQYLRSEQFNKQVNALRSGAAQPQLPIRDIKVIELPLPSVDQQEAISELISKYDDLIENNKRRIELLEESARQLYKEWFVRFRFPGYEHVKTIDGVPEGWSQKPISSLCSFLGRGMTPTYDDEGIYTVINQKCIRNRLLSLHLARRQSKDFSDEKLVTKGDVLINSTGTGTLGRVAQCWIDLKDCTVDTHVTIARPITEIHMLWFGYCLLELEAIFEGMGEGATNQKELKRDLVGALQVLVPPKGIREEFDGFVAPLTVQISNLNDQIGSLTTSRDILLSKLMSGEIAV